MPGGLPSSVSAFGSDKENDGPVSMPAVKHGISNKKRHRVSDEDENAAEEAGERAAKKRKNEPVPEGDALLAPRLTSANGAARPGFSSPGKPSQIPGASVGTPSPVKRKPVLSLSRLNMLARPKLRK